MDVKDFENFFAKAKEGGGASKFNMAQLTFYRLHNFLWDYYNVMNRCDYRQATFCLDGVRGVIVAYFNPDESKKVAEARSRVTSSVSNMLHKSKLGSGNRAAHEFSMAAYEALIAYNDELQRVLRRLNIPFATTGTRSALGGGD